MSFRLVFSLLWLLSISLSAIKAQTQPKRTLEAEDKNPIHFDLGIDVYAGTGWWVYDKGSFDQNVKNSRGWDRTRFVAQLSIDPKINIYLNDFVIGMHGGYTIFDDFEMIPLTYSKRENTIYKISDRYIFVRHFGINLGYRIYHNAKVEVIPKIGYGLSYVTSDHPERERFKQPKHLNLEVEFVFPRGRMRYKLGGFYKENFWSMTSARGNEMIFNEKNQLFFIGIKGGISWGK